MGVKPPMPVKKRPRDRGMALPCGAEDAAAGAAIGWQESWGDGRQSRPSTFSMMRPCGTGRARKSKENERREVRRESEEE